MNNFSKIINWLIYSLVLYISDLHQTKAVIYLFFFILVLIVPEWNWDSDRQNAVMNNKNPFSHHVISSNVCKHASATCDSAVTPVQRQCLSNQKLGECWRRGVWAAPWKNRLGSYNDAKGLWFKHGSGYEVLRLNKRRWKHLGWGGGGRGLTS